MTLQQEERLVRAVGLNAEVEDLKRKAGVAIQLAGSPEETECDLEAAYDQPGSEST